jgi:hypothetical protein
MILIIQIIFKKNNEVWNIALGLAWEWNYRKKSNNNNNDNINKINI